MGEDGVDLLKHEDILTYDQIYEIVEIVADLGIKKIRITGGEPFARKNLIYLLRKIASNEKIEDIGITTNGSLIYDYLETLKEIGINRINFSLDTLDREKYKEITRRDEFENTIKSIRKAYELGFKVKINTVLIKGFNDNEIDDFIKLTKYNDLEVRFIELMPIGSASSFDKNNFLDNTGLLKGYSFKDLGYNGVSRIFQVDGYRGRIGLISALSKEFCQDCNKIRLTSDGKLKACLHSAEEIDIKDLTKAEKRDKIIETIYNKPKSHNLRVLGSNSKRNMNSIGG